MPAVDGKAAILLRLAHQPVEEAAGSDPDLVRNRRPRLAQIVIDGAGDVLRDMLHERAAAADVQDLDAAADRKQRQGGLTGPPYHLPPVAVTARLGRIESRVRDIAVD